MYEMERSYTSIIEVPTIVGVPTMLGRLSNTMRQSILPLRQATAAFDQSIRADLLAARKLLGAAIFIAAWAATSAPAAAQPICISTRNIASTRVLNGGRTMVFRMRDGSEWRNNLRTRCSGLTFNGFS